MKLLKIFLLIHIRCLTTATVMILFVNNWWIFNGLRSRVINCQFFCDQIVVLVFDLKAKYNVFLLGMQHNVLIRKLWNHFKLCCCLIWTPLWSKETKIISILVLELQFLIPPTVLCFSPKFGVCVWEYAIHFW